MSQKKDKSNSQKLIKIKTQVAVSNRKYLNPETNEMENFTVIQKNVNADFNFHKIWLQDLLNILDSFGSKKIKVMTYLLSKMRNEDNTLSVTYRSVAEDLHISYPTVAATMKEMQESNVLKKINAGTYVFNPDIIIKGSSNKRQKLLVEYNIVDNDKVKRVEDYYNEVAEEEEKKIIDVEIE
jgi:DNA-binding Lrp family transcriptional regulator